MDGSAAAPASDPPARTAATSAEPTRRTVMAALLGLAAALLIPCAAIVVLQRFDGLYGQDAYAYHGYAIGPLRDALLGGGAAPPFPWPPGFPLLVAVASLVAGTGATTGLAVSLLAGATVPVTTALIAREVLRGADPRERLATSVLAGVIVALTGQLWQSSVVVMSDTTALAFASAGALAVVRYAASPSARWLALASACLAFAVATRWTYGVVALPVVIAAIVLVARRARGRTLVRTLAAGAVPGTLVLLPVLLPIVGAVAAGTSPPFSVQFQSHAWDPMNALRASFETADGRFTYPLPTGAYYLLTLAQPYFFTPLLLPLAVVGVVRVLRTPHVTAVALLLAWPLLVLGSLVGLAHQNPRFLLPLVPPVAILIVLGAFHVADAARRRAAAPRLVRAMAAVVLAVALAGMLAGASLLTVRFVDRHQADREASASLALRVPPGARLISFGPTLSLRYRLGPDVLELFELDPPRALALTSDGRPTYLLIDADAVATQWADRSPGLTVEALRRTHGLDRVGEAGSYTLFRVGGRGAAGTEGPMMAASLPLEAAR